MTRVLVLGAALGAASCAHVEIHLPGAAPAEVVDVAEVEQVCARDTTGDECRAAVRALVAQHEQDPDDHHRPILRLLMKFILR